MTQSLLDALAAYFTHSDTVEFNGATLTQPELILVLTGSNANENQAQD